MSKPAKSIPPEEIAETIAEGCLSMRIRFLHRSVNAIYDEAYRDLGITSAQGNMLVAILLNEALSPTRLGQILNIEKSTLSRNLERMRAAGLIDILDGGKTHILRPTKTGRNLLNELLPCWKEAQKETAKLLGKTGAHDVREATDLARRKLVPRA